MSIGLFRSFLVMMVALLCFYGCNATIGGALGAGLCAAFVKDNYRVAAAALCGLVGAGIGKYLSEKERSQLADATYESFETGTRKSIRTEEGNIIETERVDSKPRKPNKRVKSKGATDQCGEVKQTVTTKDGQKIEHNVHGCKKDGVWTFS